MDRPWIGICKPLLLKWHLSTLSQDFAVSGNTPIEQIDDLQVVKNGGDFFLCTPLVHR